MMGGMEHGGEWVSIFNWMNRVRMRHRNGTVYQHRQSLANADLAEEQAMRLYRKIKVEGQAPNLEDNWEVIERPDNDPVEIDDYLNRPDTAPGPAIADSSLFD